MKILVIQKKKIGDVLISTVLIEALREKYPNGIIHYLIYENTLDVVQNHPNIDKLVVINEKQKKNIFSIFTFVKELRQANYDIVIDIYSKPNSILLGSATSAKMRIAFEKWYSKLLFTHPIKRNTKLDVLEERFLLLEPLNIKYNAIPPKIHLSREEVKDAQFVLKKLTPNDKTSLIMISAIGSMETKSYPLKYMAEVLDTIAENREVLMLFNYIPSQKEEAIALYKLCKLETQEKINLDFYEPNLRKFLAITDHCKALIGNEGGAVNMAKALNIPVFAIFSPYIGKHGWNLFENNKTNVFVHLYDYIPKEKNVGKKENEAISELYQQFTPSLFIEKLINFLNENNI
jgi:heptosyltransferase-2